ncbi:hypothetical protein [Mesorhizobium sp. M0977]|uniref:hypothetical protein n=1 Tax=Mesorhizobium sp. M0977 TaxID=2957039 RepID=UPI003335626F
MAGDRLRIVMLISAISVLLFSRLRFNSRNPSKQKRHPQIGAPNAASAASFNPLRFSLSSSRAKGGLSEPRGWRPLKTFGHSRSIVTAQFVQLTSKKHVNDGSVFGEALTQLGCEDDAIHREQG